MIELIDIFNNFFNTLFNMQLIDFSLQYDMFNQSTIQYQQNVEFKNHICANLLKKMSKKQVFYSSRTRQNFILHRIDGVDLFGKILIVNNDELLIKISFFSDKLLKLINITEKSSMMRTFLKLNHQFNSIKFKMHSITGEFSINFSEKFNESYLSNNYTILQYTMQLFSENISIVQNQIKKIFSVINDEQNQENKSTNKYSLNELKGFIKASPFYAWQILRTNTHVKKEKAKHYYEDARKLFFENKIEDTDQSITKIFREVSTNKIQNIEKFQYPNQERQRQFQNTYLSKMNFKGKLITQINLDQLTLDMIHHQKPIKIQSYDDKFGKFTIIPKWVKNVNAVRHEKEILKKFVNNSQHINLPKYYFIKNYEKQTEEYIFTNLVDVIDYQVYLQSNKHTISMITKLHLIHQITLALKCCRDSEIVYHNLLPKNIFIKKGLFVKITNFSNAFHSQINFSSLNITNPISSFLPYVSNYESRRNSSFGDEKSDIYSLGNILFETLYHKDPYNIKSSSLHQNFNHQINKLFSPVLIAKQKQQLYKNQFQKLLTYLSLECIHHQKVVNLSQNSDASKQSGIVDENIKTINIKSRPYLDWMVVIIRSIIQNQKRRYY